MNPTQEQALRAVTRNKVVTSKPQIFMNGDSKGMTDLRIALCGIKNGNFKMKTADPYDSRTDHLANLEVIGRIAQIGESLGVRNFIFPRGGKFNAVVDKIEDLENWPQIRPHGDNGIIISRGVFCDGAIITKGMGVCIASAGCPTLTIYDSKKKVGVVAHAGRDTLIDRRQAITGAPTPDRPADTVVMSALKTMQEHYQKYHEGDFDIKMLRVSINCGIASGFIHSMEDPLYGLQNRAMQKHLLKSWGDGSEDGGESYWIDDKLYLNRLIKRQCIVSGILPENIHTDSIDTYSDVDTDGEYLWADHVRDTKTLQNAMVSPIVTPRNLVCVWIRQNQHTELRLRGRHI